VTITPINFLPGVTKDDSYYAAKGALVDSNRMRSYRGGVQKIGGSIAAITSGLKMYGRCCGIYDYADLAGNPIAAFGTTSKLYVMKFNQLFDITPIRSQGVFGINSFSTTVGSPFVTVSLTNHGAFPNDTVWINSGTAFPLFVGGLVLSGTTNTYNNPFSTVAGSALVTLTLPSHNLVANDLISISGASIVGGILPTGQYSVQIVNSNTVTFYNDVPATSTAVGGGTPTIATFKGFHVTTVTNANTFIFDAGHNATATATGGTTLDNYLFEINSMRNTGVGGQGWGVGGWGLGPWGTARTGAPIYPGVWTLDNFGQFLEACPRGQGIFEWQNNPSRRAIALLNAPTETNAIYVDTLALLNALGTNDTGTFEPMTQANSDLGNNTIWVAAANNQASSTPLSAGSRLMRGKRARGENLIWSDTSLYSQRFLGLPQATYQYSLLGANCGLIGENACDVTGGYAFWTSSEQLFFEYAGGQPQEVTCPVRQWFFNQVDPVQNEQIFVSFNTAFDEVWVIYPPKQIYIIFNYKERHWMNGTYDRNVWRDADVFPNPISVDSSGQIYFQESGTSDNGAAINAWVELGPQEIPSGELTANFSQFIPSFYLTGPGVSVTFTGSRNPFGPLEVNKGPYFITPTTQRVDVLFQARQFGMKFSTNGTNDYWRIVPGEIRADIDPGSRY